MRLNLNNHFHILRPYYSAGLKYGWGRTDEERRNNWGLGLNKAKIDELDDKETIYVSYGKKDQLYTIKAGKVKKYPVEKLKWGGVKVYIIPKSALNYKGPIDEVSMELDGMAGMYG